MFRSDNYGVERVIDPTDWPIAKTLARHSDPKESKLAARAISTRLGELQERVLVMVRNYPSRTTNELAQIHMIRDPREIGRRLPELAAAGKIEKIGSRPCSVTGRRAAFWRAK